MFTTKKKCYLIPSLKKVPFKKSRFLSLNPSLSNDYNFTACEEHFRHNINIKLSDDRVHVWEEDQ